MELKSAWADGTTHLLFELLEKLAALTPRPRINLVLSHGVLAPHARWRSRAVASQGPTRAFRGTHRRPHRATSSRVSWRCSQQREGLRAGLYARCDADAPPQRT